MTEPVEELERRISRLRTAVREAVLADDEERASALRRDLRQTEQDWEAALAEAGSLRPDDTEGRRIAPQGGTNSPPTQVVISALR